MPQVRKQEFDKIYVSILIAQDCYMDLIMSC